MLRILAALAALTITLVCGLYSFDLSYMDTTFGGHLPFGTLTFAPLLGFMLGRIR